MRDRVVPTDQPVGGQPDARLLLLLQGQFGQRIFGVAKVLVGLLFPFPLCNGAAKQLQLLRAADAGIVAHMGRD